MCLMWRLGRNPTGIRRPERRRGPDDEPVARLVNCGHPAPLLLRAGQVREAEPSAPSPPINLAWLVGGEYHVDVVPFAGGDTMLLYTDGVSEARDRTGAFYPLMRRLRDWATDPPRALLDHLHEDLVRYTSGTLDDDVAAIVAHRLADPDGTVVPE